MKTENRKVKSMGDLLAGDFENNVLNQYLDRKKLDFSINSLKSLDDYIDKIRKRKSLTEEDRKKIILRCGTYLGEVIRRSDPGRFDWISYETAFKINPKMSRLESRLERSLLTHLLLCDKKKKIFSFPLNKVYKFLISGRGDNTWSFAKVIME